MAASAISLCCRRQTISIVLRGQTSKQIKVVNPRGESRKRTLKQSWESWRSLSCASSIPLIYLRMPSGSPRSLQNPLPERHSSLTLQFWITPPPFKVEEVSQSLLIYVFRWQHLRGPRKAGFRSTWVIKPGATYNSIGGSPSSGMRWWWKYLSLIWWGPCEEFFNITPICISNFAFGTRKWS